MNKTYPKLYSRDSSKNIREWWMEQKGGSYRTCSGVQRGKIVESEYTIVNGKNIGKKNETSDVKQAESEIKSKYKKQLKTGYSESISGVDSTGFQEPMLAKKLKDRLKKVTFPAMVDRKYNGGRVNVKKDSVLTRQGETWKTIPHIYESLKPLFDKYPNLFIDGEGYNHDYRYNLNDLMSVLRKTVDITDEDLKKSEEIVKLYVYDGYGFDNITKETGCFERREALKKLLKGYKYIVVVDSYVVKTLEELYSKYNEFIDDGYEGAMYRTLNAPYEHKRSSNLLKVKPEDDDEGEILDVMEGTGNWSGVSKTASIKWKDKTFDVTFKGKYEKLKELDILGGGRKNWVGKTVTFLYNGFTGKGVPNYGRIDINNCFKGDR